jgi:hypothetical protein
MTGCATLGDGAVVSSGVGTLTIGRATVGDGIDEGGTVGVSADIGLSGCDIIDTEINVRAKPAGSTIQPAHPAADMMRGKICWLRDLGRESEGGGGASPCHSHKPDSLLSVLIKTASAEGDIGASSVTATASLYAWPIDPRCSACMPTIPSQLHRQTSRVQSVGSHGRAQHGTGFEAASLVVVRRRVSEIMIV